MKAKICPVHGGFSPSDRIPLKSGCICRIGMNELEIKLLEDSEYFKKISRQWYSQPEKAKRTTNQPSQSNHA